MSVTIFFTDTGKNDLYAINDFIAADKPAAAADFLDELLTRIQLLKTNPFQCRKSYYSDKPNVRDMVFKGYTVVYRVQEDRIEILKIFNQNRPGEIKE